MLTNIRRRLAPPIFAGDEDKTARARVLNTLLINLGWALLFAALIMVPLFVVDKWQTLILLAAMAGALAAAWALMVRGRLQLAGGLVLGIFWLSFLVLALFSGGSASPAMFYLASTCLIAGFVLSHRQATALVALTILIALGLTLVGLRGYELPILFTFTPVTSWIGFGLGLAFMNSARQLFARGLQQTLARAREQNQARQQAEAALRQSEERFKAQYKRNPIPAYTWQAAGDELVLVDYNDRAFELTQGQVHGLLGTTASALYRDDPATLAELRACRASQASVKRESWHRLASTGASRFLTIYYEFVLPDLVMVHTEDNTERMRAEEALRVAEAEYQSIFENAPVGVFQSTPQGRFRRVNPAMALMYGYASPQAMLDEITDISSQIYVNPDERQAFRLSLAEHGQVFDFVGENYRRDKTIFFTQTTARAVKDAQGQTLWYEGFIVDITERQRAESALRQSEAKFRAVVENSHDGILFSDAEANILYRSPSYEHINGYSETDRMGQSGFEIVHPDDAALARHAWAAVIAQPAVIQRAEYRIQHKNGSWRWIETSCQNLLGNPDVRAVIGNSRDITARREAEAALRESEARLRAVVQTANDAIVTVDTSGRIVAWNPAAENIFGYATAEAIGLPASQISPEAFDFGPALDPASPGGAGSLAGQTRLATGLARDGRDFPIELTSARWQTAAGVFATAVIRDLSERRQRENELEAIARLSTALRAAPTRAEMLPVIVEQLTSLLRCEAVSAEMIDPLTGEIVIEAASGGWAAEVGSRQPPGTGLNGVISATRQPYLDNAVSQLPRLGVATEWLAGMQAGAGVPLIAQDQLIGFVWIGRSQSITAPLLRVLTAVADIAANALNRATLHEQAEKDAAELGLAYDTTLEGWAHALELRDQETEGHSRRVVALTLELARAMGIEGAELENVRRGALLHDIGKMGIPDSVLLKPGTLNEREWELMRRHPEYAYNLLRPIAYLAPALDIPYCHHEKWDGTGYPRGLQGEQIPLVARLFAVADVWDALTSDRVYRPAWSPAAALAHIQAQAGRHFDPAAVAVFLEWQKR